MALADRFLTKYRDGSGDNFLELALARGYTQYFDVHQDATTYVYGLFDDESLMDFKAEIGKLFVNGEGKFNVDRMSEGPL